MRQLQSIPRSIAAGLTLALLAMATALAGDPLKSGLQPGEQPSAFDVQDVTGPNKGKTLCYV